MELDWCLGCGRQTVDSDQPYCSQSCFNADARLSSRPINIIRRRSSPVAFDLPLLSPTTRPKHSKSAPSTSSPAAHPPAAFSPFPSAARFADDELRDTSTARWPGKDRHGILLWAHAVSAHGDEHGDGDGEHWAQHSPCSALRAPFPLTAQIPAPPRLSHVLPLDHSPDSPSSTSSSSSSLLTPATDSLPAATADAGRARLLHKLSAWLAPNSKIRPTHSASSLSDDDIIHRSTPPHLS